MGAGIFRSQKLWAYAYATANADHGLTYGDMPLVGYEPTGPAPLMGPDRIRVSGGLTPGDMSVHPSRPRL